MSKKPLTFQEIILTLHAYWQQHGCLVWNPYHEAVGAGTGNPATLLRVLGPEPWNVGYVEPSFRQDDGRFAENPNRLLMHHQYQVILQPIPENCQDLYLGSLFALGLKHEEHDIRFVEDNWESPALGAWGLGWEVWLDGMEISQYTYFQQAGGITLDPPACELTYGLERIAMYLQNVNSVWDLMWNDTISYADILRDQEISYCEYSFHGADIDRAKEMYRLFEEEARSGLDKKLAVPAYDFILRCSNTFNILDTRGAVGLAERVQAFAKMRGMTRAVSELYIAQREEAGFPLLRFMPAAPERTLPALEGNTAEKPQTFVFELGVEELAASVPPFVAEQLRTAFAAELERTRLSYSRITAYSTPLRVTIMVEDLAPKQKAETQTVRGPKKEIIQKNPGALHGFCRKNGITPEQIQYRTEDGAEFAYAEVTLTADRTEKVLQDSVPGILAKLQTPKNMRWLASAMWGDEAKTAFNRPIRWLLCLYGANVVPLRYASVVSGRETRGGRWNGCPVITVPHAEQYTKLLAGTGVILDPAERKKIIAAQIAELAVAQGASAEVKEDVLNEVVQLVEHPTSFLGRFPEKYSKLPPLVLTGVLEKYLRCFALRKGAEILPCFIGVRNGVAEHLDIVRSGFERVVVARFSDAAYFIEHDSHKTLEEFRPRLTKLTFHEKIGTILEKADRLCLLVDKLRAGSIPAKADAAVLKRAAFLAKADLATQMVTEMSSLQGEMGAYYALKAGEPAAVATAIREHYYPRFAGDKTPSTTEGLLIGLADRLDNLAAFFSLGFEPTGTTDPYGLRRDALGLIHSLLASNQTCSLRAAINDAYGALQADAKNGTAERLHEFLAKRLEVVLREEGFKHDIVRAVLGVSSDNPARARRVAQELTKGASQSSFDAVKIAYLRCLRIIKSAREKQIAVKDSLDSFTYTDPLEMSLLAVYREFRKSHLENSGEPEKLVPLLEAFQSLVQPIHDFFDKIMVMSEVPAERERRLALVNAIAKVFLPFADLLALEN